MSKENVVLSLASRYSERDGPTFPIVFCDWVGPCSEEMCFVVAILDGVPTLRVYVGGSCTFLQFAIRCRNSPFLLADQSVELRDRRGGRSRFPGNANISERKPAGSRGGPYFLPDLKKCQ
jgi:hypothetical protein